MIFSVRIPIFGERAAVHFLYCSDEEADKWRKKMVKKGMLPADMHVGEDGALGLCVRNKFAQVIRLYEDPLENPGTLNHEVIHAVWGICRTAGIPLSDDTEEVYAYLHDYITSEIYKQYKKNVD